MPANFLEVVNAIATIFMIYIVFRKTPSEIAGAQSKVETDNASVAASLADVSVKWLQIYNEVFENLNKSNHRILELESRLSELTGFDSRLASLESSTDLEKARTTIRELRDIISKLQVHAEEKNTK